MDDLQVLQDKVLQEGAEEELAPLDVGDGGAALLQHHVVQEHSLQHTRGSLAFRYCSVTYVGNCMLKT